MGGRTKRDRSALKRDRSDKEKVKEDEIGIGIADAGSLSSEPGEGAG